MNQRNGLALIPLLIGGCTLLGVDGLQLDGDAGGAAAGSSGSQTNVTTGPSNTVTTGSTNTTGSNSGSSNSSASSSGTDASSTSVSTTTTSSSNSSSSSSGGVVYAQDWTPFMLAVWTFDQQQIGKDYGPNGHNLAVTLGGVPDINAIQGPSSVNMNGTSVFSNSSSAFSFTNTSSFTIGLWFNSTDMNNGGLLGRHTGPGYLIERLASSNSAKCWWDDTINPYLVAANDGSAPAGTWHHMVCRFDAGTLSAHMDGEVHGSINGVQLVMPAAPLTLNSSNIPTTGLFDEAFVADQALSDASIRRIFACHIDGSRCVCKPGMPSDYLDCGLGSNCSALPPCDQAMPD